jgi:hypothetical protein
MYKVAILITGELRIYNFNNLYQSIKNFDVYISTYDQYKDIAKKLSNNVLTISKNHEDISIKNIKYKNMYQWWHLNKLLIKFKKKLINYDILLKIRSDCYFFKKLNINHFVNTDLHYFYTNSDHSFYGSSKIFYKIYQNFFDEIMNKYIDKGDHYFDINYNNLIKSYKYTKNPKYNKNNNINPNRTRINIEIGIKELVYSTSIYHKNNGILIKNIIDYIKNKKKINNNQFTNKYKSGNKNFGSEKYNFLNIVNKVIIKSFELPTVGIYKKIIKRN